MVLLVFEMAALRGLCARLGYGCYNGVDGVHIEGLAISKGVMG